MNLKEIASFLVEENKISWEVALTRVVTRTLNLRKVLGSREVTRMGLDHEFDDLDNLVRESLAFPEYNDPSISETGIKWKQKVYIRVFGIHTAIMDKLKVSESLSVMSEDEIAHVVTKLKRFVESYRSTDTVVFDQFASDYLEGFVLANFCLGRTVPFELVPCLDFSERLVYLNDRCVRNFKRALESLFKDLPHLNKPTDWVSMYDKQKSVGLEAANAFGGKSEEMSLLEEYARLAHQLTPEMDKFMSKFLYRFAQLEKQVKSNPAN